MKINACLAVVENDTLRPVEIIDLYMLYSYRYSSFNQYSLRFMVKKREPAGFVSRYFVGHSITMTALTSNKTR